MKADFVFLLVNYSRENKNPGVLTSLEFPQRFGFPVLVVLNGDGNRIHTQNTAYLEEEKSYSVKKILEFLMQWSAAAVDPGHYE